MNENDVIIVIPYYSNTLNDFERFSLETAQKVFSKYTINFVSPKDLLPSPRYQHIKTQYFDRQYFHGLRGYNQLLLSEHFYGRFLDYKYILIYQLDALVFNDELQYWCSLGYDYYGAPWNSAPKKDYYNFYGLLKAGVGNGGFSLRKTLVFHKMTKQIKWIRKYIWFGEDIFWCTYGKLLNHKLKIIDSKLAIRFAFESRPEELFYLNDSKLPFGCHAFEKNDLEFWRRVVPDLP